jgi:hypothetical protein
MKNYQYINRKKQCLIKMYSVTYIHFKTKLVFDPIIINPQEPEFYLTVKDKKNLQFQRIQGLIDERLFDFGLDSTETMIITDKNEKMLQNDDFLNPSETYTVHVKRNLSYNSSSSSGYEQRGLISLPAEAIYLMDAKKQSQWKYAGLFDHKGELNWCLDYFNLFQPKPNLDNKINEFETLFELLKNKTVVKGTELYMNKCKYTIEKLDENNVIIVKGETGLYGAIALSLFALVVIVSEREEVIALANIVEELNEMKIV